jgi:hypothetical protein
MALSPDASPEHVRRERGAPVRLFGITTTPLEDVMANDTDKSAAAVTSAPQAVQDSAKRPAGASLDALRAASDEAEQTAQAAGEAFRFARDGADEAASRIQDWMGGSAAAAHFAMEAGQEIASAMLDFTRGNLQRGVDGMTAIARCRTVAELLSVQGDLMRDGLRDAVTMGQRLVAITSKLSGQTQQEASAARPAA